MATARVPGVSKVIAPSSAVEAAHQRGGVVGDVDYGAFHLLLIDEKAAGGRAALASRGLEVRDEMNGIALEGWQLDTRRADQVEARLPAALRRDEIRRARVESRAPADGLYLVQFVGPVRDAWLSELTNHGLEIVSYVPENAYVVRARGPAAAELVNLENKYPHVQYVGDFQPAYRLATALGATVAARTASSAREASPLKVVVQVPDGPDASAELADLRSLALDWGQEHSVLNFHNVELTIDPARVNELAAKPYVFHVEEVTARRRLDEKQGQIEAGNLTGNAPSGPGYLSWLSDKGFAASGQFGFSVNVADDAYDLNGHPDLPDARIAFENNPTQQTGVQGGHGFLNSHIIGGFNNGTGSAFTDASGFHYGLGISPFAKVGITAIFGNGTFDPTAYESTAYGQGARISSNSWGFTGTAAKVYDTNAQAFDRIVRDAQTGTAGLQQYTVVFAAGNDGSAANTVSSPGTAKNVISVGASENVRTEATDGCAIAASGADSANDIISFSSRGPVNSAGGDGRIKPDIVAPGTHIIAGVPQNASNYDGSSVCDKYFPSGQTLYGWSSGTSHSTPGTAGAATLVYQDFLNKGRPAPSPAMVKGYLLNSATRMTGVGANDTLPSNNQGWGRVDLGRAFDGVDRLLVDQTQVLGATGETYTATGTISSTSQPFRVTLAWTDAAGPTTGAPWVNNLDLEVTVGGTTYKGNVFSGGNSTSGGTADAKNNVEGVYLPAGTSGNFTITVRGTNIAGDGVPGNSDTTDQDFALVVYNGTASTPTGPAIGVSPSSLSFTATAGGANPANQSVSVSNTGSGTLNWSASDDATWLTVSPTSGTAPSTASAAVNIAGLAAGVYNGTIAVAADGASNTPVSVPVTLTVNGSGGGGELITNGGFEGSATPWVLSGQASFSTGSSPHSGTGFSVLGVSNNAAGSEYQSISIPSDVASANLTFWLNVTSSETTTATKFDNLFVEVRNSSGTLLTTLASFSNLDKVASSATYTQRGPYNLSAYKGQTVRVQFRATTDVSLTTSFRVDDVSVK